MSIDGELNNWIYWEHTKAKHQILRNYLGRWLAILGQWHPKLFICDGFAGRGEYQDGSEGSPVIILRTANALMTGGKVGQVICAFIEKNEENFSNLSKVLQKAKLDYPAVKVLGPYESALETAAVPLLKMFVFDDIYHNFWNFDSNEDMFSWHVFESFIMFAQYATLKRNAYLSRIILVVGTFLIMLGQFTLGF